MRVVKIDKVTCDEFVSKKHYSRKPPIFWAGFALIEDDAVQGVCVFGQPSPPIQKHAFEDRDFRLFELTRLVVQSKTKNASSFLVGNALKLLEPQPCAVVSYADSEQGHCGFIYQATNWLYTGATVSHDKLYMLGGVRTHPMTLRTWGITDPGRWAKEYDVETVSPSPKHRYFYFCGNKYQKRQMQSKLKYDVVSEFPKVDPSRYDDGPQLVVPAPKANHG